MKQSICWLVFCLACGGADATQFGTVYVEADAAPPVAELELAQAAQALGQQPLSFGMYSTEEDRARLYGAIDCAVYRWRFATGLPLDVALQPAHIVKWDVSDQWSGHVSGAWSSAKIQLHTDLSDVTGSLCQVLVHEMGHILRKSAAHPGPDGSMSHPTTRTSTTPVSKITQFDINAVCAVRACAWETPE